MRHRQTKGAENRYVRATATAPHLDSTWRVPFWISIVMVGIGLWIRLGILETPVFQRILDQQAVARAPVIEVLHRHPKEIILTALARMGARLCGNGARLRCAG